jgi:hypothetical protein
MLFPWRIPSESMQRIWMAAVYALNMQSGRLKNRAAMLDKITTVIGLKYPFDCQFYQERSAWPHLDRIKIPVYFGCHWGFWGLHLRGAFSGWMECPQSFPSGCCWAEPHPRRPVAEYHQEMPAGMTTG